MRKGVRFLLYLSRFFASCAVLAGLGAGFLVATFFASFTCFDTCPAPDVYFSRLLPGTAQMMAPCVAIESLALALFVGYCLAAGQAGRILRPLAVFLVGGLIGSLALYALILFGQVAVPVTEYGLVAETPAVMWMRLLGLAIVIVAGAWSGGLARLQWGAE
jgi:hypothetical protein